MVADEPREEVHNTADEVVAAVVDRFDTCIAHESHGQAVVYVEPAHWHEVAQVLRDEQQFSMCLDVTAVDHLIDTDRVLPAGVRAERFEVVANFVSLPRNRRVRTICEVPDTEPEVDTLTDLYPGVNFGEREVYDLFGISFTGHPDLTRILMPDDWSGHPLRKDAASARVPVTFKEDPGPR